MINFEELDKELYDNSFRCSLTKTGMTNRNVNALLNYGFETTDELKEFVKRYGTEQLRIVPGFGKTGMKNIDKFLKHN